MNFGTLKSRILDAIGRDPADICYELVTAEINEHVRIASMQTEVSFAPVAKHTLPADFLEAVSAYHDEGDYRRPMEALEPAAYDASWITQSYPNRYSVSDGIMRINGTEGGGTVNLRYYQKQADLTADADTNSILTNHPAIYLYGVFAHHAAIIRDNTALSVHFPAYERAVSNARKADIARRTGGNVSGPRPRVAP